VLIGEFEPEGLRPQIAAHVLLPRLDSAFDVKFVVDTGAPRCLLSASDVVAAGLDATTLRGGITIQGVGGPENCFEEEAYLVFMEDDGARRYYNIRLLIRNQLTSDEAFLPSLLGRDVLHRWRMFYFPQPPRPSLRFDVVSDDLTLT
jgi:hypothetical protein